MNNKHVNTESVAGNNIVQVTSNNAKLFGQQAEASAQKAGKILLECLACKDIVQELMIACSDIKTSLENMILNDLDDHLDNQNNPHLVTASQINSYTKSETDYLLSTKQPAGNYLTSHQDISGKANSIDLATVATTGDYDDLLNKPSIPPAQVQSNWNEIDTTNSAYIQNKPNLATVATTGDYDDLLNKPSIPDAQIQADWSQTNNSAVDYIKNKPAIPTVPTSISSFTNDSGYITGVSSSDIITALGYTPYNGSSNPNSYTSNVGTVTSVNNILPVNGDVTLSIPTVPTNVSSFINDAGYTTNIGTVTGVTMNGVSKGTSGVIDLGTVITSHQDISGKENTSNKVTSLSSASTDTQYPSAKCIYDLVGDIETVLMSINGVVTTYTLTINVTGNGVPSTFVINNTDYASSFEAVSSSGTVTGYSAELEFDEDAVLVWSATVSSGTYSPASGTVTMDDDKTISITWTAGNNQSGQGSEGGDGWEPGGWGDDPEGGGW